MPEKRVAPWFAAVLLALLGQSHTPERHPALLNLPILPAHLAQHGVPLIRALSYVSAYVQNGYVLFGVELRLDKAPEPVVNVDLAPGSTLGDALRQIFREASGYRFEVAGEHLVNIYPVGATADPDDILNLRLARFDAVAASPLHILAAPQDFIPELKQRLTAQPRDLAAGYGYGGQAYAEGDEPRVTLHLANVTVRQILDAASEATAQHPGNHDPVGWEYSFSPDSKSPTGGLHSWSFVSSVPSGWRQQPGKPRMPPR